MPTSALVSHPAPVAGVRLLTAACAVVLCTFRLAAADDTVLQMNPFEVQADPDNSYAPVSSNSITNFNVALKHLPISADIFDQTFINDVAATTVEDMVESYSAGVGYSGLDSGTNAGFQPGDRGNLAFITLRGQTAPTIQRDSLLALGTFGNPGSTGIGSTSNFDIQRVELINGPQSLLYDGGGPGGVFNVVSKQAMFGRTNFGSVRYRIDQYGSKNAELDVGVGRGPFAIRLAVVNASNDSRRVNIGDRLSGTYLQAAWHNQTTTVRVSMEQTTDLKINSSSPKITATGDHAFAALQNMAPGYLLAKGQGPLVDNGELTWDNLNSFQGALSSDLVVSDFLTVSAHTRWTDWLSTQMAFGWSSFTDDFVMNGQSVGFYTPGASSNPRPGGWTFATTGAYPAADTVRPYRGHAGRFSVLLTKDLPGGTSQTNIGISYGVTRGGIRPYAYFLADAHFAPVVNPAVAANLGRTPLPQIAWSVNAGPVLYPVAFRPGTPRISYGGANYVRAEQSPLLPGLVSPSNQIGAAVSGPDVERMMSLNSGLYAVNYSQWMHQKLDTLLGVRLERAYTYDFAPNSMVAQAKTFNFNAAADYYVRPQLAPYVSISNSFVLPPVMASDPAGVSLPVTHALGEEVGLKFNGGDSVISGTVCAYFVNARDQNYRMNSSIYNEVNPAGLNGRYPPGHIAYVADTQSRGVQLNATAAPNRSWRMRLSAAFTDGQIGSTRNYAQYYNDDFHTNAAGQVTFADGSPVYVPAAFNPKQLTTTPANGIPLTIQMLSTPVSAYYANPALVSGQIASSSNAAKVLRVVDPVHGAILTGATGLPISALQLDPSLTPGLVLPGSIDVARSGDVTTGYPEYSVNFTVRHEMESGRMKGLALGGTVSANWKLREYYFYPNGIGSAGAASPRALFSEPLLTRFDTFISYTRAFRRVTWTSQLNVFNLFNYYRVTIYPNPITGNTAATGLTAAFDQQPRSFSWTNTISF
ncbi:MAG TPA: TonB-dependent receptor plug domain-containing protein [Opitutaceae bacterium]|nr:TonB-dependent receptor plug domain-containing protein [Opitutaceae bacterium]